MVGEQEFEVGVESTLDWTSRKVFVAFGLTEVWVLILACSLLSTGP